MLQQQLLLLHQLPILCLSANEHGWRCAQLNAPGRLPCGVRRHCHADISKPRMTIAQDMNAFTAWVGSMRVGAWRRHADRFQSDIRPRHLTRPQRAGCGDSKRSESCADTNVTGRLAGRQITLDTVSAGLHCSLRISRHMLPLLLMFGCRKKKSW